MHRLFSVLLLLSFATLSCGQAITTKIATTAGNGVYGYAGDNGAPLSAEFTWPTGMTFDAAGNLVIADIYSPGTFAGFGGGRVRVINNQATTQTLWGVSICSGCIGSVAGGGASGAAGYSGDNGPATSAQLNHPCYVAIDASGNLYIADQANNVIRKVTPGGTITTFAGGGVGHCSPCAATSTVLAVPQVVVIGPDANLYIATTNYNLIEVVNLHGTTQTIFNVSVPAGDIATIAGTFGSPGYSGDGGAGTSASLYDPLGVAFDSSGNLYIADTLNNVVRKLTTAGTISTVVGTPTVVNITNVSFSANVNTYTYTVTSGPALTTGTYMFITGCTSAGNNSFGAPNFNPLRITALGAGTFNVSTTHGVSEAESTCTGQGGIQGFSGNGGVATSARMYWDYDIKIDAANNFYISDTLNNQIRYIDHNTNNISSLAGIQYTYIAEESGPGVGGLYSGDGGLANFAHVNFVVGILPDTKGNIWVADSGNFVVRKLTPVGTSTSLGGITFKGGVTVK